MTTPESIVDAQVEHLLKVVNQYEQEHCDTTRNRARVQADLIIKDAYLRVRAGTAPSVGDGHRRHEAG